MINVLVTSVGGGVGQSVLDSIAHLKSDYYIVGLDLSVKVYGRNQCDAFVISPRIDCPSYINFLLSQCHEYSIDIIVPGNDGELELLSLNKQVFEDNNVEVVVSPIDIVASSRNKYNWYKDHSDIIKIVPTALYEDYIEHPERFSEISFPVIVKPSAGSASAGIRIFSALCELRKERLPKEESNNYVVQPYLMPKHDDPDYPILEKAVIQGRLLQLSEISCQIVYSKKSEIIGVFVSKNSLKNGVPVTIEPVTDRDILSVIEDIAENLKKEKVVGPVNLQGRLTEKGLVFFEMNLRFTGITGNRSQFGFNEVSSVINSFVGSECSVESLSLNTSRFGVRQVACITSYPLENRKVKTILVTGAGSWAAKNFVTYLEKNDFLLGKCVILSSRDPQSLKSYMERRLGLKNHLCNVYFIGVSELELTKGIGVSDVVINFASARPPHGVIKIHESTVFNLLLVDLIKKGNPGLVVNMSSQSVYFDYKGNYNDYTEDSITYPATPYAISKLTVEHAFTSIRKLTRGTEVVNVRLGRLWSGELDIDKTQFPFRLLDAILGEGDFVINNPKNKLSMLDVDDLSFALVKLILSWECGGKLPEIVNLGGINTSLEELLSSLENMLEEEQTQSKSLPVIDGGDDVQSFTISSALAQKYGLVSQTALTSSWRKLLRIYLDNE